MKHPPRAVQGNGSDGSMYMLVVWLTVNTIRLRPEPDSSHATPWLAGAVKGEQELGVFWTFIGRERYREHIS